MVNTGYALVGPPPPRKISADALGQRRTRHCSTSRQVACPALVYEHVLTELSFGDIAETRIVIGGNAITRR